MPYSKILPGHQPWRCSPWSWPLPARWQAALSRHRHGGFAYKGGGGASKHRVIETWKNREHHRDMGGSQNIQNLGCPTNSMETLHLVWGPKNFEKHQQRQNKGGTRTFGYSIYFCAGFLWRWWIAQHEWICRGRQSFLSVQSWQKTNPQHGIDTRAGYWQHCNMQRMHTSIYT